MALEMMPWQRGALIGAGATLLLDLWLLVMWRLGWPTMNFRLLGRWTAYLGRGVLRHAAIAQAPALPGELALGWLMHYAVGMVFGIAMLLAWPGAAWALAPTPGPALLFGIATVAAPLCVLQPAMGAGLASSRTPAPLRNSLRSVRNHAVFGLGLYGAALVLARLD